MRFHYGAPPENPNFDPEAEGWRKLAFDPGPLLLQLIAIPVAVLLAVLWGILFYLVLPVKTAPFPIIISPLLMIGWLTIILILIPAHELLHALIHPHWGRTVNTILGLWLSKGVFYAHYEGEMSRNRFLMVALTPYLVLGLLPLGWLALLNAASSSVVSLFGGVSLLGSVLACGDIIGVLLLLFQIPAAAVVRNKGWRTYWKLEAQ